MRRRSCVFLGLLLLTLLAGARAQADAAWLATEVSTPDRPARVDLQEVAATLTKLQPNVIASSTAVTTFETSVSRAPTELQANALTRADDDLKKLAQHVASESLPEALSLAQSLAALPDVQRDFLNRDRGRARRRFQICLMTGHLLYVRTGMQEGLAYARECYLDFPGFRMEPGEHMTRSLRDFLVRTMVDLDAMSAATLRVDVAASDGQACRVRLNGIDEGPAPVTIRDLRIDRLRVAADCGQTLGRSHSVQLRAGDNTILIDPTLDRAVSTSPHLGLHYADDSEAHARALDHSVRIAKALAADQIVQVWSSELVRIDVAQQRVVARASLGDAPLETSLRRLFESDTAVRPAALAGNPESRDEGQDSQVLDVLAWSSTGLAVAGLATAVVAWRIEEGAVSDFLEGPWHCEMPGAAIPFACLDASHRANSAKTFKIVGLVSGIGFGAAAVAFFLMANSDDEDTAESRDSAQLCGAGPGDIGVACKLRF